MSTLLDRLKDHWVLSLIGLIAGVLGIITFGTGKNLPDFLTGPGTTPTITATDTADAPEEPTDDVSTNVPEKPSVTPSDEPQISRLPVRLTTSKGMSVKRSGSGLLSIDGEAYPNSFVTALASCSGSDWTAEWVFDLSREYKRLTTTAGLSDKTSSDSEMKFRIYVDGNTEFDETLRLGESVPLDIDVGGALRVTFELTATRDLCGTLSDNKDIGGFGDPTVYPN